MRNIVTVGGSSGIGLALVQNLINDGCAVTNISRTPCNVGGVKNICADVSDSKSIAKAFKSVERLDTLVYCAGYSLAAPVEYVDDRDVEYIFKVNIIGAIECIKYALPKMSEKSKRKIILLSSSGGVVPIAFDSFYSATKSGLIALAHAVRAESPNIKCTAVIIPGTQTQFSFKRKIYTDCGEYNERLKSAADALIKIEQTGCSADYVAKKIADIISSDDPPPTVTVGSNNKLALAAYRLLPWRIKELVLKMIYKI